MSTSGSISMTSGRGDSLSILTTVSSVEIVNLDDGVVETEVDSRQETFVIVSWFPSLVFPMGGSVLSDWAPVDKLI